MRIAATWMTILAWLAELGYMLSLLPNVGTTTMFGYDITSSIVAGASLRALWIVVGITLGSAALFWRRHWNWFCAISACLYLIPWYAMGSTSHVQLLDAYRLKWETAWTFDTIDGFVVRDVILPIVFLLVIAIVLVDVITRIGRSQKRNQVSH